MKIVLAYLLGAATVFLTGFGRAAGSDAWAWLKKKLNPPPPQPELVPMNFTVPGIAPTSCVWVPDHEVVDHLARGFTHVLHPEKRGPCYARPSRDEVAYFLMKRP
ncbi:MAG TPA: hypothetical protein VMW19_07405 [Myxococcota bacterium]|nr:hypothetical protein [Myxococcota bacterium]